jgi:hypothetical protein
LVFASHIPAEAVWAEWFELGRAPTGEHEGRQQGRRGRRERDSIFNALRS